jgi:hypothetical protein
MNWRVEFRPEVEQDVAEARPPPVVDLVDRWFIGRHPRGKRSACPTSIRWERPAPSRPLNCRQFVPMRVHSWLDIRRLATPDTTRGHSSPTILVVAPPRFDKADLEIRHASWCG